MDAVVELQNEIVALRARVAQLEAEQQVGVVSVGADITEHLNTYDAMLRSEARFKAIFDGSGLGVSLVDADGHILAANQALCRLLGYTEEEMRRLHFADFTHPDDVDRDWQLFDELLNGQHPRRFLDF